MNKALFDTLLASGMAAAQAELIAKSFPGTNGNATVDVDKLAKSLEGLREAMAKGGTAAIYTQEDMDKLARESGDVIDAVTKASDKMSKSTGEHIDKLTGAVIVLCEKVAEFQVRLDAQTERVSKSLGLPLDRKSVVNADPAANGVQPSPNDGAKPGIRKSVVADAALAEMAGAGAQRREELAKAISQLNAGAEPEAMAKAFRITLPA